MPFLRRLRRRQRRLLVIGLDGTPYSYLMERTAAGELPNLARLLREGSAVPMRSSLPFVSSVAWSTILTGVNPAGHGIFGFIDRQPGSGKLFIPNARHLRGPTLYDAVGAAGKRSIVVNVPVTYPPRPIEGVLVAGFLAPRLEKATYPPELADELKGLGYVVDVDPALARTSKDQLLEALHRALEARFAAMERLLAREDWTFAIVVLMETDRLHHFFWRAMEEGDPTYAPAFAELYRHVDEVVGRLAGLLEDGDGLALLSDHGFGTLKKEVYVNVWLREQGYLRWRRTPPKGLADLDPSSRAYSLDPGRIYLNLRGREPEGSVDPADYEALREELAAGLAELRDPETGERAVRRVFRREEIYAGPLLDRAPDLILLMEEGYQAKGRLHHERLFDTDPVLVGEHTYEDAFFYLRGARLSGPAEVRDVLPTLLGWLGVPVPERVEGRNLLEAS